MKTGKKHSNKSIQEEKPFCPLSRNINHQFLALLKNILMKHWQVIENQPLLRQTYKEPPFISYKRGRSLKDILVKAKL